MPLAPYTVVNPAAGVSHIRHLDYPLGTALGMTPGILLLTAVGHQPVRMLAGPTAGRIVLPALVVAPWIGLSLTLQALLPQVHEAR